MASSSAGGAGPTLDAAAYDAQRLALDSQAMAAMQERSDSESSAEEEAPESAPPGAWKWQVLLPRRRRRRRLL